MRPYVVVVVLFLEDGQSRRRRRVSPSPSAGRDLKPEATQRLRVRVLAAGICVTFPSAKEASRWADGGGRDANKGEDPFTRIGHERFGRDGGVFFVKEPPVCGR